MNHVLHSALQSGLAESHSKQFHPYSQCLTTDRVPTPLAGPILCQTLTTRHSPTASPVISMNLESLEDLAKVCSTTDLAELNQLACNCKPKVTEQLSGLRVVKENPSVIQHFISMNMGSLEDLAKVYSTTDLAELHQLARSCKPKVTELLSGLRVVKEKPSVIQHFISMNLDSLEDLAKVYSTTDLAELHQLARSCKPKVTET